MGAGRQPQRAGLHAGGGAHGIDAGAGHGFGGQRGQHIQPRAGGGGLPEPDYTVTPLRRGDRLILCSDGVHGVVPDRDLVRVVEDSTHPQAAANALIDLAIALGTQDNATAVVVEVTVAAHSRTTPPGAAHREVRAARPATVRTARRRHEGED